MAGQGRARGLALVAMAVFGASVVRAEDWPRYRGPQGNGYSRETDWKKSGEVVAAWKAEVGLGYACVVVAEGRAYTTGHDGRETDTLVCLDAATGKELWQHRYPQPLGALYFQGGTTGTPTVSGGRVFQVAREGEVFCLDARTGAVIWTAHLRDDLGLEKPDWGFTGGALVHGDLLLLTAGEGGVALRVADGTLVWKSGEGPAGYSAPLLVPQGDKNLLLVSEKRGYACVDPVSGTEIWRFKWLTRYGVNAADPVIAGDSLVISSGYGKGAARLRWTGSGQPETLWQNREMRSQMNPGIVSEGHLYGIDGNESEDRTGLKCLEVSTGKTKWLDESVGHGALIAADGHLLVVTEQGDLRIGPMSPEGFAPTRTGKVLPERCWTQPSLSGGMLYARGEKGTVVCVDLKN